MHESVDVLVVTALKLEREAVREHLLDIKVEAHTGLSLDTGRLRAAADIRIAVLETGAGNVGAAVLTARAEDALRPAIVAMVGIAGGVKDVGIGDVVASSKIYWIESGKQRKELITRPDFAPVSAGLIQIARACAADDAWVDRISGQGGAWPGAGRPPTALVAPVVAGEKVVADARSHLAELIHASYSDAVAIDMEDFGTLRGGAGAERARTIAIRGISDLLDDKSAADASGSQPLAAANAAAFLADVLVRWASNQKVVDLRRDLHEIGCELYPDGPQQDGLWERAGGDPARLQPSGPGSARWWHAVSLLHRGGGGDGITAGSLLTTMSSDYPSNERLRHLTE